ncbi:MAG: hypothetical protein ACR2N4_08565 [Jatrophihabitans sp.]
MCIDNITLLSARVTQASVSVVFHPASASSAGSHWSWSVSLIDQVLAGSSRRYQRRIECERALRHFLSAARTTPLPTAEVRRIGQRLGTCPA